MAYRISVDIGGTFTDIVAANIDAKATTTGKVLSTPENPALGVMTGLQQHIDTAKAKSLEFFVHGTTVGLNAFLERKGARVLLIMTAGLRDSYTIARGDRKTLYALQYRKPERLVPRRDVLEVRERLRWDGSIFEPLHEEDFEPIIQKIRDEHIQSVAICFIHAYVNPVHELRAREILQAALGDNVSITLSHEIAREWREYERASSAVMNAYIAPIVQRYLTSLEQELADFGVRVPVHVMQSSGGVIRAKTAREQPVHTLLSGPVGGTIGGAALSRVTGRPNLLCIDMGGTSFDMSLIIDGKPSVSNETEQEGLPLLLPLVEIHTIGAGGGSLAWLEAGALRVGPQSAGADPGPACYGRGGTQPTVTDANLFLGRIGKEARLGGWMALDEAAAESAIHSVAEQLGLSDVELAEGILSIINAKMADAIRTITIQVGIDPRNLSLVAFGGAGSMHAVWLARELDIKEIIVPWSPGTFSAWGMLQTDIRRDLTANFFHPVAETDSSAIAEVFERLVSEGKALLVEEEVPEDDMYFTMSADMRYIGQEYFVTIPIREPFDIETIDREFHDAYKVRYGHSTPGAPLEFVNLRLAAFGRLKSEIMGFQPKENVGDAVTGKRDVIFDGKRLETVILNRDAMPIGEQYHGPHIVEEDSATTVVPPGYTTHVDEFGNMIIMRNV
ncbi:MAG: hydantoinase/oxoprolinase family protein [Chloroflexi bacterium]|nr:MAG: 5-oxoprolinase [Phototrophicales bacterium]RMF78370.1 MAG: hydantoinase/oxoprolinase family protein [Chloroflexota bacterium]